MGSIYDYSTGEYLSTSGDDFAQLLARFEVDQLDRSLINPDPLTGTYYPFYRYQFPKLLVGHCNITERDSCQKY